MVRCAVFGCNSNNSDKDSKKDKVLSFYSFPTSNPAQCAAWVNFCNRKDKINIKFARICEEHFEEEDKHWSLKHALLRYSPTHQRKIKPGAIPCIRIPVHSQSGKRSMKKKIQDDSVSNDNLIRHQKIYEDVYHPLITPEVEISIVEGKSVLLTPENDGPWGHVKETLDYTNGFCNDVSKSKAETANCQGNDGQKSDKIRDQVQKKNVDRDIDIGGTNDQYEWKDEVVEEHSLNADDGHVCNKKNTCCPTEKKRRRKKTIFNYSREDMHLALNEVRQNPSAKVRVVCRKYQIPHSTFLRRLKLGSSGLDRKMGPATVLTCEEENVLVKWIEDNARKGIQINKRVVLETVKEMIDDTKKETPFSNNTPGLKWFKSFLKRHPDVNQKYIETCQLTKTTVTEERITQWYSELQRFLIDEGAIDILGDPQRIFNSDESGFPTCPDTGVVLGPRGGIERDSVTVLVTMNAAGEMLPAMIVYPCQQLTKEITQNIPQDWCTSRSDKGWMDGHSFYSYITKAVLPMIEKKCIPRPVLYIVDGLRSHLTLKVTKFCKANGIILYGLYQSGSQPADISVFKPLKHGWKQAVANWKKDTGHQCVTKPLFPLLLHTAMSGVKPETIVSSFQKSGIYTLDPNCIDFSKYMIQPSTSVLG